MVIAGNWRRGRISKDRREVEELASAKAARAAGPLLCSATTGGNGGGARRGGGGGARGGDGCAHPRSFSMTLRLSGWAAGRATAISGRDAWRSGVDWVGAPNPGGRAGGKGSFPSRRSRANRGPGAAAGFRLAEPPARRAEKRPSAAAGRRNGRGGLEACNLLRRRRHGHGRFQLGEQAGVNGDVGERPRDGMRRAWRRRPQS